MQNEIKLNQNYNIVRGTFRSRYVTAILADLLIIRFIFLFNSFATPSGRHSRVRFVTFGIGIWILVRHGNIARSTVTLALIPLFQSVTVKQHWGCEENATIIIEFFVCDIFAICLHCSHTHTHAGLT